jgi:hypothetical protein
MYRLPLASLALRSVASSAGTDIGVASLLAVALLIILYFAHARETASLRNRLEDANDRIGRLEQRVAQLLQLQAARAQREPSRAPVVTPPPAGLSGRRSAVGVAPLRRADIPAAASAPRTTAGLDGRTTVQAPPFTGAPALGSATRVAGANLAAAAAATNNDAKAAEPADGAAQAATTEATSMLTVADLEAAEPDEGFVRNPFAVPAATAAAAATVVGSTAVGHPDASAPSEPAAGVEPYEDEADSEEFDAPPRMLLRNGSGSGGGSGQVPRRTVPLMQPSEPQHPRRGRGLRTGVITVVAVVVVVAVVLVLLKATGGGLGSGKSSAGKNAATTTAQKAAVTKPVAFDPAKIRVAVLNGTSVAGLAKDISSYLSQRGYGQANVTNAAIQTQQDTIISYIKGEKSAAEHVAKVLKISPTLVQLATASVLESCATSPTSASANVTCRGEVIVTVGADRESLAGSTSTSTSS